jgi:hypothetical protein
MFFARWFRHIGWVAGAVRNHFITELQGIGIRQCAPDISVRRGPVIFGRFAQVVPRSGSRKVRDKTALPAGSLEWITYRDAGATAGSAKK